MKLRLLRVVRMMMRTGMHEDDTAGKLYEIELPSIYQYNIEGKTNNINSRIEWDKYLDFRPPRMDINSTQQKERVWNSLCLRYESPTIWCNHDGESWYLESVKKMGDLTSNSVVVRKDGPLKFNQNIFQECHINFIELSHKNDAEYRYTINLVHFYLFLFKVRLCIRELVRWLSHIKSLYIYLHSVPGHLHIS